jgi:hypothetical protein
MDSDKCSARLEWRTGRRYGSSEDEKLKIILEN